MDLFLCRSLLLAGRWSLVAGGGGINYRLIL